MSKRKLDLSEELLPELKCQMCKKYTKPPIYLCKSGHIICDLCNNKSNSITDCKIKHSGVRCLALENLVKKILHPCAHQNKGCSEILFECEIEKHLEDCLHISYKCPFHIPGKCSWLGLLKDMENHIMETHPEDYSTGTYSQRIVRKLKKINSRSLWYGAHIMEGNIFFRMTEKLPNCYNSCITFVGSKKESLLFMYKITMEMKNPEESVMMRFPMKHYESNMKSMVHNCDCPCFSQSFAKKCVVESGGNNLELIFEIEEPKVIKQEI
ncbi:hypothetical protein C0J52_08512 [Blattella germanica]|nr:hypothetical protein C0J52_08512 [Blattella germanica]